MDLLFSYTITDEVAATLAKIRERWAALVAMPVTPEERRAIHRQELLRSAHYSTKIEGNPLSFEQAREITEGRGAVLPVRERDRREIENYQRQLDLLNTIPSDFPISPARIQDFHRTLTVGTLAESWCGAWRTEQNAVFNREGFVVFLPPEPGEVSLLMEAYCDRINDLLARGEDRVAVAGLAHQWFVLIHPFMDGNGRTARIVMQHLLDKEFHYEQKFYLSLEGYYAGDLASYYGAIACGKDWMEAQRCDGSRWLAYYTTGLLLEIERVVGALPKQ